MTNLDIKKGSNRKSAYNLRDPLTEPLEAHTLAVIVDNESGVLARVIGLFSGRGYNIDSLTVAEVDHSGNLSRITIVTSGTPAVIEQIKAQLERMVPVHEVHDLTVELEGSISAEHGIGRSKVNDLIKYSSPVKLDLMKKLKNIFDPNGIMNPGVIIK